LHPPADGGAEPEPRRRIIEPDPDAEGAGDGIGARRDLPHAAGGADRGIDRQHHLDQRILGGGVLDRHAGAQDHRPEGHAMPFP
jgi:hypothetical protein